MRIKHLPVVLAALSSLTLAARESHAQAAAPAARPAAPARAQAPRAAKIAAGSYGCTSSAFRNGSFEYTPRGSVEIAANGAYRYLGLEKPSAGRYTSDAASGELSFQGGYLNSGKATPMEDRPGRFYLVFPTMPGGRWTCGLK